jgi:dienelactone hydrolase
MKAFFHIFLFTVTMILWDGIFLTESYVKAQIQNVRQLDTVYTPSGYDDGPLMATMFIPDQSIALGVGVVLGHGLNDVRLGRIKPWCDTLSARGYVAMTIDFPELTSSVYPKPVRAFKVAVEFLRRNAARFGLDTINTKIFGLGKSQGSVIWGETIIWDNDDGYFGTDPEVDDHLSGAILFYGGYDFYHNVNPQFEPLLTSYFSSDPSLRATKGQCITNWANITTPLLLFHGTNDEVISIEQSRELRDSLLSQPDLCTLIEYDFAAHGFDVWDSFTDLGLVAKDLVLAKLQYWIEKYSGVDKESQQPITFELEQNYPNPFNPSTTVQYSLPKLSKVKIILFNLLGQEVATLVNEEKSSGNYKVNFDASNLPSGVYFYQLKAGNFIQTKKMILLK